MAVTQNTYTGNGSTTNYSITFEYLEEGDIKVTLNGTLTTAYTFANATTISFNTAPANGAAIRIYRDTVSTTIRSTFFPGSAIRAQDLNDNFIQSLYINQETQNFAAATDASAVQATANAALSAANSAVTTANTANATANGIAGTANSALSTANSAVSTATTASTNASTALSTANTAQSTANTAQSTANTAQSTANAAMPKAGGIFTGDVTFSGTQTFPGVLTLTGGTLTGNLNLPSINGGQIAGIRNRIINGAMAVDARNAGASQTFTAGAALAYNVDRWYGYCTGANVTGQCVQGASVGQFRYQFTGAASVTGIGFGQRIEQLNSADLANTTATLSVDLANSVLTTVTWTAYYANTANTFGTLASPTRTQIATGTFTVNSTVTRYNTNISIPAAATTGIEIVFTVGAQTSGTWTIGNVQLEAGSVATPFERRSYGQELALCQRYYEGQDSMSISMYTPTTTATNQRRVWVSFHVQKRAAPTITVSLDQGLTSTNTLSYVNGFKHSGVQGAGLETNVTNWTASIEL